MQIGGNLTKKALFLPETFVKCSASPGMMQALVIGTSLNHRPCPIAAQSLLTSSIIPRSLISPFAQVVDKVTWYALNISTKSSSLGNTQSGHFSRKNVIF